MSDQDTPKTQAELVERIRLGWDALHTKIDRLSDAQLTAPIPGGSWSIKDHVAHLAAWERTLIAMLQNRPRHEGLGVDEQLYREGTEESINAAIYQRTKDRPLAEIVTEAQTTHRRLLDVLAGMTDADLQKGYSEYMPDEPGEVNHAPIIGWIIGNTYGHYAEHAGWIQPLLAKSAA